MPYKPIDNTYLLASLDSLLTQTRDSHTARPDVSALVPFVRDVVLDVSDHEKLTH
jgi:Fis family transcriptional regulator